MGLNEQKCCVCGKETGFIVNINFKAKFVCDEWLK